MSEAQDLPDPNLEAKYVYESHHEEASTEESHKEVNGGNQSEEELQESADAPFDERRKARSSSPASSTASDDDDLYLGEKGDFDKRPVIPLLQFLDASGEDITADNEPSRVASARPRPGSSLRLDELLAAGVDVPSQVWTATVLPTGYKVIVKLFTDQHAKLQPDLYVSQETYETKNWSRASLGRNAQWSLCRERDRFISMIPIQGNYVPYSFGYYAFTISSGETCVGHVMEYVPHRDIYKHFHELIKPHDELVDRFYTSFYRTYLEVHRHDVVQLDAGLRNILLYPHETKFRFVLVDFSAASSINYRSKLNHAWAYVENLYVSNCLQDELDQDTYLDWSETEDGRLMIRMFSYGPEEHAEYEVLYRSSTPLAESSNEIPVEPSRTKCDDDSSTGVECETIRVNGSDEEHHFERQVDGTPPLPTCRPSHEDGASAQQDMQNELAVQGKLRRSTRLQAKAGIVSGGMREEAAPIFSATGEGEEARMVTCQVGAQTTEVISADAIPGHTVTVRRSARLASKASAPSTRGTVHAVTLDRCAAAAICRKRSANTAFAKETVVSEGRPIKRALKARPRRH